MNVLLGCRFHAKEHKLCEMDSGRVCHNLFMFAGGSSGWNPVDIYILMRNKKLVTGEVWEIVWGRTGETLTRIL